MAECQVPWGQKYRRHTAKEEPLISQPSRRVHSMVTGSSLPSLPFSKSSEVFVSSSFSYNVAGIRYGDLGPPTQACGLTLGAPAEGREHRPHTRVWDSALFLTGPLPMNCLCETERVKDCFRMREGCRYVSLDPIATPRLDVGERTCDGGGHPDIQYPPAGGRAGSRSWSDGTERWK
jgi:hypothetical protein